MAEQSISLTVPAPRQDVFSYLADLSNLPSWDSSVRAASPQPTTRSEPDTRYDVTVGFYGRELKTVYELSDLVPDRSIRWEISGKVAGTVEIETTDALPGTRIDYRVEIELNGMARLLDRGLGVALEGIAENTQTSLRRVFET